jgi:hypothetical protein
MALSAAALALRGCALFKAFCGAYLAPQSSGNRL